MKAGFSCWMKSHSGWIAVCFLSFGMFGFGYGIATLQAQADAVARVQNVSAGYKAALDAKDKLINQLAGSAVRATGQAADATTAAVDATETANKAAATAKKAADAVQAKSSANRKALEKMK